MAVTNSTMTGNTPAAGQPQELGCSVQDVGALVQGLREAGEAGGVEGVHDHAAFAKAICAVLHGAADQAFGEHDEAGDAEADTDAAAAPKKAAKGKRKTRKKASAQESGDMDPTAMADALEPRLPKQVMQGLPGDQTQTVPWAVILPMIPTLVKMLVDLFRNR